MSEAPVVTLIVHGTFARDECWWRLSDGFGVPTFADRLESTLADRGCTGSVWQPPAGLGFRL